MAHQKEFIRHFRDKLSQALPYWSSVHSGIANSIVVSLLLRLDISDVPSYLHKLRVPIAICVVVGAGQGAFDGGFAGFVIGGLLGLITPVVLIWLVVVLTLIAMFLLIYVICWSVLFYLLVRLFGG